MSKKPKNSDGVGYKRPPKHSQFKPGQSGNPKGRPKGARSLPTVLAEELRRTIPVRENGRTRHLTKLEVFVRKTVNDAIQGTPRDAEMLTKLLSRFLIASEDTPAEILTPAEQAILDRFLAGGRAENRD